MKRKLLSRAKTWWAGATRSRDRLQKPTRRYTFPASYEQETAIQPSLDVYEDDSRSNDEKAVNDEASYHDEASLCSQGEKMSLRHRFSFSSSSSIYSDDAVEPPTAPPPAPNFSKPSQSDNDLPPSPKSTPQNLKYTRPPTFKTQPSATSTIAEANATQLNETLGHIHNWLCPAWRPGDSREPRPECPDRTFTLSDVNVLTTEGRAHLEVLKERDVMQLAWKKLALAEKLAEEDCD